MEQPLKKIDDILKLLNSKKEKNPQHYSASYFGLSKQYLL